jgi:hypothetical protein
MASVALSIARADRRRAPPRALRHSHLRRRACNRGELSDGNARRIARPRRIARDPAVGASP